MFAEATSEPKDYSSVIYQLDPLVMKNTLATVEDYIQRAVAYVRQWLQYQALWDISVHTISDKLGRSLVDWQRLLVDIRTSRATIESSKTEKTFGPIVIAYASGLSLSTNSVLTQY